MKQVISLVIALVISTQVTYAAETNITFNLTRPPFPHIEISTPEDIARWCKGNKSINYEVYGCYIQQLNYIFISSNVPSDQVAFTLGHELGHYYFVGNVPSAVFDDEEYGADMFSYWLLGYKVKQNFINYFKSII